MAMNRSRSRSRMLLSAFPREMLNELEDSEFMNSLLKHMKTDVPRQLLLTIVAMADDVEATTRSTIVAVADDVEANGFATARSTNRGVMEWLCHFQDAMYLLEEFLHKFGSGEATGADAKPELDFIFRSVEIIARQKHLLFRTAEQQQEQEKGEQQQTSHQKLTLTNYYKENNEMVEFLLSDDRTNGSTGNTSVIAVVGTNGVGKTSLADLVYHDEWVKSSFNLRGWVGFRKELDAESLGKIILDSFNEDFHYDDSTTELNRRLHQCLQRLKFLLVLENFEDVAYWETLRPCFAGAAPGSAVILTTPRGDVAIKMRSDYVLSLEDSHSLSLEQHESLELTRKVESGKLALVADENGASSIVPYPLELEFLTLNHGQGSLHNLVRLELTGARKSNLPNGIGELRCLEYIDLSFSDIRTLPDSISVLSHLQTLKLSFCCYLHRLPSTLANLAELRHLDLRGTKLRDMPLKLESLRNLEILVGFSVNSGSDLTELASASNIQTLSITDLQNIDDANSASEANLKEKRHLEDLTLRWNQLRFSGSEVLEYLQPPTQLKMLEILGCPDRSFPGWLGDESFWRLETLHIRHCRNWPYLPPLGQLSSLKELFIQGCDSVRSIGNEFYGETNSHVPFESLQILWFVDMPKWKEWILLDDQSLQFPCLRELYVMHCPELLHDLPKHLPSLENIKIYRCDRLKAPHPKIGDYHELMDAEQGCTEIPESSSHHAAEVKGGGTTIMYPVVTNSEVDRDMLDFGSSFEIVEVSDASELHNLPFGLKSLRIESCQNLDLLRDGVFGSDIFELFLTDCFSLGRFADVLHPNSLRTLYIHKCPNLKFLAPVGVHNNKFELLEYLCISSSCNSLKSISISLFPRLQTLYIKDCPNLESLSMVEGCEDQNLKLESLGILDCPNLVSFPKIGLPAPDLKSIIISNCTSLSSLPSNLATLASLRSLLIDTCPKIESFPDGGVPSSLTLLSIAFSDKLVPQKKWNLHTLPSLTHLKIEGGCIDMKSFPDKDLLPRSLKSLHISSLSDLRVLNDMEIQKLIALETLEINGCIGLYSLPEGFPSSLKCLRIKECSILTQKLLYKASSEWSKIAHIPNLQINDRVVRGS